MTQGRFPEFEKGLIERRQARLRQQAADERAINGMDGGAPLPLRLWQAVKRVGRPVVGLLSAISRQRQAGSQIRREERQAPRFGG